MMAKLIFSIIPALILAGGVSAQDVMLKGKWYTQAELNGWLDEIAPNIAGSHIEKK